MKPRRLISALLRRIASPDRVADVLGDLEEAHRRRVERHGRFVAWLLTMLEGLDMTLAIARLRVPRPRVSWLDVKLGVRMLRRYPGLTAVAGLALGFAIAIGALTFEVVTQALHPTLPLAHGDRLVGFRLWNAETGREVTPTAADLETWRTELRSVEHVSAFRSFERNLITPDGQSAAIFVAEMSAAAFEAVAIPALAGRNIIPSDETPGAPDVLVIGFDVWQERFGGAPDVVGRIARLGAAPVTIVGVMPEGFAFPIAHEAWTPLRLEAAGQARRDSPPVGFIFGRLSPGASLASAQAEVAVVGARVAREFPDTHARVSPDVLPYVEALIDLPAIARMALHSTNLAAVLFLALVAGNVALLMFARTVSREAELAMRSALGASRGRIVTQLFVETLVLGLVSAVAGLGAAAVGMRWVFRVLEVAVDVGRWPFWLHDGLSPMTPMYAVVLAGLVALIAGAGPAFRVTGTAARWKAGAASGSTVRFGGIWTGVIVTQVALTVACLPLIVDVGLDTSRLRRFDLNLPADEFVTTRLVIPDDTPLPAGQENETTLRARFEAARRAMIAALVATPGVRSATYGSPPGDYVPIRWIDVEGPAQPARSPAGHRPQVAAVAPGFFDVFGGRIVAGRDFVAADARDDATAVVVNQSFVQEVLGGAAPIGRRLRFRHAGSGAPAESEAAPQPWLEIVGVVTDLPLAADPDRPDGAGVYTSVSASTLPIDLIVHAPEGLRFAPRLRAIAARVDPALRVSTISTLGDLVRTETRFYAFWFRLSLVVVGILLLLSLSGIYAVVSFTVSRRTREIGIRLALGADRLRLLSEVLATPMLRVVIGATTGAAAITMLPLLDAGYVAPWLMGVIAGSAALVVAVSVLACAVPIRRALRIQPTEALRAAE
ncbi:MAG TPA: ABC transporter permease [Vicinamibacterales bacterium]|nr:ABC transporter permease [Vicinamibacterales bacterium]